MTSETPSLADDRYCQPYPIEFRAWSKKDGLMLDWLCLMQTAFNRGDHHLLYEVMADPNHRFVKMLSTGLLDKRRKLIYEGDIVEAVSQGHKGRFEVRWRQGGQPLWLLYPAWQNREFWKLHGSKGRDGYWTDDGVEVIGNIFENPLMRPEVSS